MNQPIQIAIVDDHTLFRDGLAALLSEFADLNILFKANNGQQLQDYMQYQLQTGLMPQVILMDINMPVINGRDATKWLKINHPEIKVLALSMFNEEKEVIQMLRAGASGYLVKESDPKELREAIRSVQKNGFYFNEMVSGKLLHSAIQHEQETQQPLTTRELDFLRHICSEQTYKEIAEQMCVSVRTVDNYRDALFAKLNIRSRTGLVLYCIKNNLVNIQDQ